MSSTSPLRLRAVASLASLAVLAGIVAAAPLPAATAAAATTAAATPVIAASTPTTVPAPFDAVVDLTFPARGRASFGDDYRQPRSGGRVHKATDLLGAKLDTLHAAVDGVVCSQNGVRSPMPTWGYALTLCGDDGRRYVYLHLNNDTPGTDDGRGGPEWAYAPGIRQGVRVRRGQWIGYMGDSGNAETTAPHLHFEIHDPRVIDPYGTNRLNPHASLAAARRRGDLPRDPGSGPLVPHLSITGSDVVATAIATSVRTRARSDRVVLTTSAWQDLLIAAPLAAQRGAPLLVHHGARLDRRVGDELNRLGARSATVVGAGVPSAVVRELRAAGVSTDAIAGTNRTHTAELVAAAMRKAQPAAASRAIVVAGTAPAGAPADLLWSEALGAAYLGALDRTPVLFAAGDRLASATRRALAGSTDVTLVGRPAALPVGALDAVRAAAPGARVRRLSGTDRYGTALAVGDAALAHRTVPSRLYVASGTARTEALLAAAAAGRSGDAFTIIDGSAHGRDEATGRWLYQRGPLITLVRSVGAVSAGATRRVIRRAS